MKVNKRLFNLILLSLVSWLSFCPVKAQAPVNAISFRDIFLGAAGGEKLTQNEKNNLVYLPTEKLTQPPQKYSDGKSFFEATTNQIKGETVENLYNKGLATPIHPVDDKKIESILSSEDKDRLTVVIVPGIFGEMIRTRPFEEVFEQEHSTYREEWKRNLKTRENNNDETLIHDKRYSLEKLNDESVPLSELLSVSTINDKNGKPLANVILLNTKMMSLETLGKIEDKSPVFLRRLDKFFNIMGTPNNIAFVGYSRGTPQALDMLSMASQSEQDHPWLKNTKAMISLGGVNYGSEIADDAANPNSPNGKLLNSFNKLTKSLALIPENATFMEKLKVINHNNKQWGEFLSSILKSKDADKQNIELNSNSLWKSLRALNREFFDLLTSYDYGEGSKMFFKIATETFTLNSPLESYNQNILRLQKIIQSISEGVSSLSTENRLKWWGDHTIPTNGIHYYSIGGVMPNSKFSELSKKLSENHSCYNTLTIDHHFLAKSVEDFIKVSGIALNDSQVSLHKEKFWPEIAQTLNPNQKPFNATDLGVVGVHHWGLALREAIAMKPAYNKLNSTKNPFPREALLKAIAATVMMDIRNNDSISIPDK